MTALQAAPLPPPLSRDDAARLDAADPLAPLRDRFVLPEHGVYLDGNSLGALPRQTAATLADLVTRQWGSGLIASWNRHDWIGMPARLGAQLAPLIGAAPHEVIVADSVSANLFKLIAAALLARPGRPIILMQAGIFPTDSYIAEGVAALRPGTALRHAEADRIAQAIDATTAIVVLTHVHYTSGHKLDMTALTAAAHASGALILWDLSHSTGAVPVDLAACNADMAVGCGYKYLNGGPGAPAFLFVAERLHATLHSPLSGWMGHAEPFAFEAAYRPAPGLQRFLCGTPSVLAMAALATGLAQFEGVALPALFAKSRALGDLAIRLMAEQCAPFGFTLASPTDAHERGSHLSFAHPHAYAICQALIVAGVTGDFRVPNLLRLGFAPLYTAYTDVWDAVAALRQVMQTRAWDKPAYRTKARVT